MKGVFLVTGTDTGCGKTHVSCALLRAWRRQGFSVAARKPVESGCAIDGDTLVPSDAVALRAAAGDTESLEEICALRLEEALAPGIAATRAGKRLDLHSLAAAYRTRADAVDVLLVEGAGGLLVPLVDDMDCVALAELIGARLIVVVGVRLGGLNHALLTLQTARARGCQVEGVVLNHLQPIPDLATVTFRDSFGTLDPAPILAEIPFADDGVELLERYLR
jgi:dethiobiotin synthetase